MQDTPRLVPFDSIVPEVMVAFRTRVAALKKLDVYDRLFGPGVSNAKIWTGDRQQFQSINQPLTFHRMTHSELSLVRSI